MFIDDLIYWDDVISNEDQVIHLFSSCFIESLTFNYLFTILVCQKLSSINMHYYCVNLYHNILFIMLIFVSFLWIYILKFTAFDDFSARFFAFSQKISHLTFLKNINLLQIQFILFIFQAKLSFQKYFSSFFSEIKTIHKNFLFFKSYHRLNWACNFNNHEIEFILSNSINQITKMIFCYLF
jgi:hypothetical protein